MTVIDGATNATTTVAAGTARRHRGGPATDQIYVANRSSNNVTVIDGATNATSTVAAGTNPVAVAVNPATDKIYVANFDQQRRDGDRRRHQRHDHGGRRDDPSAVAVNPNQHDLRRQPAATT